jgi:hypothetical protein
MRFTNHASFSGAARHDNVPFRNKARQERGQIALSSPATGSSFAHSPGIRRPCGVISTPGPLRLPLAYSPSNCASGLPFSVQRKMPLPDAKPSLQSPDHVTDSSGWGWGFQILQGLLVAVIQPGAGSSAWAMALHATHRMAAATMMPIYFTSCLLCRINTRSALSDKQRVFANPGLPSHAK